ncbi:MAG: MFS family permease [Candidatus Poriferisodalaceae bacterium]|jgi:MFS family permease
MLARLSYAVQFLLAASIGLVFVFLADLQERYGLSDTELGVVASTGFLAALVTQIIFAPFVDRGRAGAVAWVGVIAGGIGTLGFVVAEDAWSLALSRGLVGVGLGLFGVVARKALLGLDAVGGGAKVGALLSAGVAGFISGPAVGAALGEVSFEAPFLVVGVGILVVGVFAARIISTVAVASVPATHADIGALLHRPRVQVAIMTQLIVFGFIGIFDATVDVYLTDLGMSNTEIAMALVAVGAPMLFLPKRAGALAERIGGGRVLVPALVLAVPVILAFGYIRGVFLFMLFGSIYSVSESFSSMGGQMLVLEATGAERVAVGSSILDAVGMGMAAITAFGGPWVYGRVGERWLFGGWAAFSALLLGAILLRLQSIRPVDDATGVRRSPLAYRPRLGRGVATVEVKVAND